MTPLARDVVQALKWFAYFVLIMAGVAGFALRFFEVLPYLLGPNP